MNLPAVCVIVPVYNAEATLARCVESILSQNLAGGLCCVLVNDGSTDGSPALCDAFAARDNRVLVVHQKDLGVSAARNAGLNVAKAQYYVFLDSDDYLLPGALDTALRAQTQHPGTFVCWQYETGAASTAAPPAPAVLRPRSALARLYLDCLVGMPWNKLYRAELVKDLRFDPAFSLGEDLEFVLDYLAALAKCTPEFCWLIVQQPLTHYTVAESTQRLSTRYQPDGCTLWLHHDSRLNGACEAAGCPPQDLLPLHRAELEVIGLCAADVLARDPVPAPARRRRVLTALHSPQLRLLLDGMHAENNYSAWYLPLRHRLLALLRLLAAARRSDSPLYGKLDWLGYYLMGGRRARD
jgi:hypothetical protein